MMNFSPAPKNALNDVLTSIIDGALVTKRRQEYEAGRGSGDGDVAKHRIGAGYIGVECGRQLAYKFHKAKKEPRETEYVSPGELQRHAEAGFWTEEKTSEWLRLAGLEIYTKREDGTQYGYKVAPHPETGQYRIAGEIDGVICGVPSFLYDLLPTPCLWESKKATAKKWTEFHKNGVKTADPKYHGQLQTNMAYLAVGHTLFSMLNLDTMKYYWELIPFDVSIAQALTDRAVRVLESVIPEELERVTTDPNDWRCKFCDYRQRCWSDPEPASSNAPSWMQGVAA